MNTVKSNRIKTLFLNGRQLMVILSGKGYISNVPDYTKIVDIREEYTMRKGFLLLLEHPSFPEVNEAVYPDEFMAIVEVNEKSGNRKLYFD